MKLRRGDDWELLDAIDGLIRQGRLPLFVTEGSALQKQQAIDLSPYLRFAHDKLGKARDTIVVYGCAFADADHHIVSALDKKRRSLAVSIHVDEKSKADIEAEVKRIHAKLAHHDVVVVESRGLFASPPGGR